MKNITPIILSSLFSLPGISLLQAATLSNHSDLNSKYSTQLSQNIDPELQRLDEAEKQVSTTVNRIGKDITVRITSATNGGSGVLIAKKSNAYLVLTNAHVTRRTTQVEIQALDGQKYTAKLIDGGFDRKYDLALLEFTSSKQYQLANLSNPGILKPNDRNIYSAGFPFDSKDLRISPGAITQLSDIPFDNGTQVGYEIAKGEKGVRQGMSGGPIFDASGVFLGINTIGAAPILPNYTYNDGSKPLAKLAAKYRTANWGVPVYNFLVQVKPDLLYGYKFNGLAVSKIQHQATLTGYMAKLNDTARKQTVRIENSGGNGSGIIVAREGSSYYVVTAKHVVESEKNRQKYSNNKLITYDQDTHNFTSTVVAEGVDLAVVKFSSNSTYPIAQLSETIPNTKEIVLAGGFPGRDKINSSLWQWQLNPGYVFDREQGKLQTQDKQSFENGYDLIYSSISYGGMSGGAIFDSAGRAIGIHGKAEQTNGVMLGNSQGISMQTLIGLAAKLQLNPKLLQIAKTSVPILSDLDRQTIVSNMQNLTQPNAEDEGERWLTYGNQLARTRQSEKAVAAFNLAISKGQIVTGNYGLALSLAALEKFDLAQIAIAKAIAAVPPKSRADYYYFWNNQSSILRRLKKYDLALKSIDIAIKLEPRDSTLTNQKATILSDLKQYKSAIKIYDNLIENRPEAYVYMNRGIAKSDLGDTQGALSDFNRSLNLNPNLTKAYIVRGIVKFQSGDNQGALSDLDRAIQLNPNDDNAYATRGTFKLQLGDNQGALSDLDRSIELKSNNYNAYGIRGTIRLKVGDKQGALSDLNQSIKLNSDDDNTYMMRGNARSELGDKQGALSDYDRAIAINPNNTAAYNSRGLVKLQLGDKQGALADYDRAVKIKPNDTTNYMLRGLAKSQLGDKQGAISDLSQAAELFRQQKQMDLYQKVMGLIAKLKGS